MRTIGKIAKLFAASFIIALIIPISSFGAITFERTYGGTTTDEGYSVQQTTDEGYIIAGSTKSFGAGGWDVYLIKTNASGDTLWTRTYGGTNGDGGYSVQQTTDKGYIIVGWTWSFGAGECDVYLIKTNASGDTLWTKAYGGVDWDCGYSVQQTTEGGYIIAGMTESFGAGDWDVYLIKTSASGDTLWTKAYGGTDYDWGNSVRQTTDGGYIIAGRTKSFGAGQEDVYLIKTGASGDALWTRTYGGTDYDCGFSVQQTTDEGYIIAGKTESFGAGSEDVYLIRTNASGTALWTKTYGTIGDDRGYSVQQTPDGGFIIAGIVYVPVGATWYDDVYLIKTNSSGDALWTKTYGDEWDTEWGYSVHQTTDGGYIITGCTHAFGAGGMDVYLIKTNASGDTLWTKAYGGTDWDYGYSVQQTKDGGYIIAGITESFGAGWYSVYLIRTNASGTLLWSRIYGGTGSDFGYSVQQTTDKGYIIAGSTSSFGAGSDDFYLIKTDSSGTVVGVEESIELTLPNGFYLSQNYPNPFNPRTEIEYALPHSVYVLLTIYNIMGQRAATLVDGEGKAGYHKAFWDGRDSNGQNVSTGIYFYRIQIQDFSDTKKMLLIR